MRANGFGERLNKTLSDDGISRKTLATLMHVEREEVCGWCNGTKFPNAEQRRRLSVILCIPLDMMEERIKEDKAANKQANTNDVGTLVALVRTLPPERAAMWARAIRAAEEERDAPFIPETSNGLCMGPMVEGGVQHDMD